MSISIETTTAVKLVCPCCAYDLTGVPSDRCPECGTPVDLEGKVTPRIPWAHAHHLGIARAYWQMVRMTIRRPSRVGEEVVRPVSFIYSQRFRHITVLLAYVPLLCAGDWIVAHYYSRQYGGIPPVLAHPLGWLLEGVILLSAVCSLWLFLFTATGVASYFFHPRRIPVAQQNRAVALSYYACAPLAVTFVPATAWLLLALAGDRLYQRALPFWCLLMLAAMVVPGLQLLLWWTHTVVLLRRTTQCSRQRAVTLGLFLPAAWAFLFCVIGLGIPAAVAYVSLVILSLRS